MRITCFGVLNGGFRFIGPLDRQEGPLYNGNDEKLGKTEHERHEG